MTQHYQDATMQHGQQPQQPQQTGMQTGQGYAQQMGGQQIQQPQTGTTGGQQQQQTGITLDEALTNEQRMALEAFAAAIKTCEWCADQCLQEGPHMMECIRRCRDVVDVASACLRLFSRNSIYQQQLGDAFITAANACAQECAQHSHSHCQECASILQQATNSVQQLTGGMAQQPMAQQQR